MSRPTSARYIMPCPAGLMPDFGTRTH